MQNTGLKKGSVIFYLISPSNNFLECTFFTISFVSEEGKFKMLEVWGLEVVWMQIPKLIEVSKANEILIRPHPWIIVLSALESFKWDKQKRFWPRTRNVLCFRRGFSHRLLYLIRVNCFGWRNILLRSPKLPWLYWRAWNYSQPAQVTELQLQM